MSYVLSQWLLANWNDIVTVLAFVIACICAYLSFRSFILERARPKIDVLPQFTFFDGKQVIIGLVLCNLSSNANELNYHRFILREPQVSGIEPAWQHFSVGDKIAIIVDDTRIEIPNDMREYNGETILLNPRQSTKILVNFWSAQTIGTEKLRFKLSFKDIQQRDIAKSFCVPRVRKLNFEVHLIE